MEKNIDRWKKRQKKRHKGKNYFFQASWKKFTDLASLLWTVNCELCGM